MKTIILTLSIGILLLTGCSRRVPRSQVVAPPVAAATPVAPDDAAAPASPRLRYFDVRDLGTKNGILIMRGSKQQLKEVDEHLSAIRSLKKEAQAQFAGWESKAPTRDAGVSLVVQIHSVADIVTNMDAGDAAGTPQERLLAIVQDGLGSEANQDCTIRFQGEQALVIKAPRATQERVNEILDGLRQGAE